MTTSPPIACSLSATEMPKRLGEIRALGADALQTIDRSEMTARLSFRASGETRGRLAAIVAAESHCCAFLDFDLRDADAERVVLTITSPADDAARLMLDELADAFAGRVAV